MHATTHGGAALLALNARECTALLEMVALLLATAEMHQEIEWPEAMEALMEQLVEVLLPLQRLNSGSIGETG